MRVLQQVKGLLAVIVQMTMLGQLLQDFVQHLGRGGEHGGQAIISTHLGYLRVDIDQRV